MPSAVWTRRWWRQSLWYKPKQWKLHKITAGASGGGRSANHQLTWVQRLHTNQVDEQKTTQMCLSCRGKHLLCKRTVRLHKSRQMDEGLVIEGGLDEEKEIIPPDFPLWTRAGFISNKDSLGGAPSQPPAHTSTFTISSLNFVTVGSLLFWFP